MAAWLVNSTIQGCEKTLEIPLKCSYSRANRCLRNWEELGFPTRFAGVNLAGAIGRAGARAHGAEVLARVGGVGVVRALVGAKATTIRRTLVVSRGRRVRRYPRRSSSRVAARPRWHLQDLTYKSCGKSQLLLVFDSFAGYLELGCSCTPDGPRSFCEMSWLPVFTGSALSPPVRVL